MKESIILKVHRKYEQGEGQKGVIRVDAQAEDILRQLSAQTGLTVKYIASQIIIQGAELVSVVEV